MHFDGLRHLSGYFDRDQQENLVAELRKIAASNPLYTPTMPRSGRPMSVKMTNMGFLGWVADINGYRYQSTHPETGKPWPAIPDVLMSLWSDVADYPCPPEACLLNYYMGKAKMGLHQDVDEKDFAAPVVSVSLGDTAIFRIGGLERKDPTRSFKLASGDVLVMAGQSRKRFHGVDRIMPDSSSLLSGGGRVNLTLRRVNLPETK